MELLKTYKLKFKLLTPLFIASGDEIEPFELVPMDNNEFVRIDVGELVEDFSPGEQQDLWDYINRDNIIPLRKFLIASAQKRLKTISGKAPFIRYRLKATPEFHKTYCEKIDSPEGFFPTLEFIKHPNGVPYIPGSSIKGAIRTAILNNYSPPMTKILTSKNPQGEPLTKEVLKKLGNWGHKNVEPAILSYQKKKEQKGEKIKIFSDLSLDPFRLIRIADVQLPADAQLTLANCYNVSIKRGIDGTSVPIRAKFFVYDKEMETTLSFVEQGKIKQQFKEHVTPEKIITACNIFYRNNCKSEIQKFLQQWNIPKIQDVLKLLEKIRKKTFILRLGRFSHNENMTIHLLADSRSTSRTLFEKKTPLGWLLCRLEEE